MRKVAAGLMVAGPKIGLRIVGYADIAGSGGNANRRVAFEPLLREGST